MYLVRNSIIFFEIINTVEKARHYPLLINYVEQNVYCPV